MSDVIITVRGEHSTRATAEIGVAVVSARLDGPDRGVVVGAVTAEARRIADELAGYADAKAVSTWSTDRVSVWSDRPWNQDGRQLPLVYHATVTARAEFSDFTALSDWLGALADRDGVSVDSLTWDLTPTSRTRVEAEVAQGAVGVAVARAHAYASAIDLHRVSPVQIADAGMLQSDEPEFAAKGGPMMMRAMSADAAGGGLSLEPRDITVSATVEARFTAS